MKNIIKKEDDWSRNLVSDMENLLETGTLTDVTIKCDKKTIKCHKAVLSARSAVFMAMFQHDMRENKNNEIIIQVMLDSSLRSVLLNLLRILTSPQSPTW